MMITHKALLLSLLSYYMLLIAKIFPCMGCLDSEREALTKFKQSLVDPSHRLASWNHGLDCCKWDGVSCDNETGYVITLDLHNPYSFDDYLNSVHYSQNTLSLGARVLGPALEQLKHLQHLDLSGNDFGGIQIPDFLGSFQRLRYLNLSHSEFEGRIPQYIGNLSTLEVLDLSYPDDYPAKLSVGNLEWLAKMESLRKLRMRGANMGMVNQNWVQVIMESLPSLTELSLSDCDLSYIPQTIPLNNFTRLRVLDLGYNPFNSTIPSWVANITSLVSIDLTSCLFYGEVPSGFSQLPYLQELRLGANSVFDNCSRVFSGKWESIRIVDLRWNRIYGGLPTYLGNLSKLEYLRMTGLSATKGVLPISICQLKNLNHLLLEYSNLAGSIPTCFGQLSSLEVLILGNYEYIGNDDRINAEFATDDEFSGNEDPISNEEYIGRGNQFNETLREVHFEKLSKLRILGLPFSGLKLNMKPDWVPPFQLQEIHLHSQVSTLAGDHKFPPWLQTQKSVQYLDLSNTSISDTIPSWFWNFAPNIIIIHLRQNNIFGQLPNPLMIPSEVLDLDLRNNRLSGPIPSIHSIGGFRKNRLTIDLSSNQFTGPIPPNLVPPEIDDLYFLASGNRINGTIPQISGKPTNLSFFDLSNNDLIGSIPSTLCDVQSLGFLDLSENQISGNIPLSMGNCTNLYVLNLRRNQLIGSIPSTLGQLRYLDSLHLNANNLTAELPFSLSNCSSLTYVDLSSNHLVGSIPTWFSSSFPELEVLSLRSNKFTGKFPPNLTNLGSLQVLDLAQNYLRGQIPQTFQNLQAMRKKQDYFHAMVFEVNAIEYIDSLLLTANGKLSEYNKILSFVVAIDLSDNLFSGKIPDELCDLHGLGFLNLSGNHFSGKIPQDIGNLHELMSLDLSRNQLSGPIPSSISNLTFLRHLNVSYNRLRGMIPSGPQLQTLNDPSIYMGNLDLCGPPLKDCAENKTSPSVIHGEAHSANEQHEMLWMYMGMGHGFVVGFCGFFGILAFKRGWRIACFKFFDDMIEWSITVWVLNISRLQKKIRREN